MCEYKTLRGDLSSCRKCSSCHYTWNRQ